MRTAAATLLLALASSATAQDGDVKPFNLPCTITACGNAFITMAPRPKAYVYEPKEDVTARELSVIIPLLLRAAQNPYAAERIVSEIDKLPPEVRRHFREE